MRSWWLSVLMPYQLQYVAAGIAGRLGLGQHPAVGTVVAQQVHLHLKRATLRYGLLPARQRCGLVVGVHGALPVVGPPRGRPGLYLKTRRCAR